LPASTWCSASCNSSCNWPSCEKAPRTRKARPALAPAQDTPTEGEVSLKPARLVSPEHQPRERLVHPGAAQCPCCGGRLRKHGRGRHRDAGICAGALEGSTCAREVACRACGAIIQASAPFHPIARGRAGPQLLAQIMIGKYRAHLPLNRQSEIYAGEGVDLSVSTLADWVGAAAASLMPLSRRPAIMYSPRPGLGRAIDHAVSPGRAASRRHELLCDPTFERDAVTAVLRHGFSSENPEHRSIPKPQSVNRQGRAPSLALSVQSLGRCRAGRGIRQPAVLPRWRCGRRYRHARP